MNQLIRNVACEFKYCRDSMQTFSPAFFAYDLRYCNARTTCRFFTFVTAM